ncbi:hypothetical protein EN943_02210 [Mesorhizobium sp. M7A.F.Ca.US.006.01.1.1]|uniref:hypothetical protein n=1 Tax=Mesorhizobium sp. M7A.F.Ca.US.006.01.1.1 TaxID=2496707 RepID=UPI000FCB47C3|nr:hypothetical protein [Mesorhizobium sp. M7A.F.Ca.US.006.01.1.1]RUZ80898.1 hypothetical protein EN943_02210 [Mesorhizobium sp. M7A.F.Ca.US.006.01.1.1]
MNKQPNQQLGKFKRRTAPELEAGQSAKDKQYQKFVEKARELETDESEEAFDRVLKKVVKAGKQSGGKS